MFAQQWFLVCGFLKVPIRRKFVGYFGQILSQNIALCLYLPRKLNKKPSILIFLAPTLRKMCPSLLKTCSWVIAQDNSL